MKLDNLCTCFFKAKYFKSGHMASIISNPVGSRFWKTILKVFSEVFENVYVKVKEGKASFWFDKWLSSGLLAKTSSTIQHLELKIQDC